MAERGATMLEFALVVPLLLLLAFGTAEMGLAWVANNRAEGSTSTAARIAASSGKLPEADLNVLLSLRSSLPEDLLDNLDRVVIFEPVDADGAVPTGCIKAHGSTDQTGITGRCNTYTGATVRAATSATDLGAADSSWPPSTRDDALSDPGGPDDVGVWIRTVHENQTGTYFGDFTITKTSIYRIQPDIDG